MSSDIYLNGITYPASRKVAFPGKDGKEVVFDLPTEAEAALNGTSTRPPQTKVVYEAVIREAAARDAADEAIRQQMTSPFNFKGTVAEVANLPGSGNTVNDTYYVEAAKCRYSWTGSAWKQSSMDESDYADNLGALADVDTGIKRSLYGPVAVSPTWQSGRYDSNTGEKRSGATFARTADLIPFTDALCIILSNAIITVRYRVYYYDANRGFLGYSGPSSNAFHDRGIWIKDYAPEGTAYFTIAITSNESTEITSATAKTIGETVLVTTWTPNLLPEDTTRDLVTGPLALTPKWEAGRIDGSSGTNVGSNEFVRTKDFIPYDSAYCILPTNRLAKMRFRVMYYDENQRFLGHSGDGAYRFHLRGARLKNYAPEGTVYFRVTATYLDDASKFNQVTAGYTILITTWDGALLPVDDDIAHGQDGVLFALENETLTQDTTYTINNANNIYANLLLAAVASYSGTPASGSSSQRPGIAVKSGNGAYSSLMFIGDKDANTLRTIRAFPVKEGSRSIQVFISVPEGMTLHIQALRMGFDNAIDRSRRAIQLTAHTGGYNAPAYSERAVKTIAHLGARHCVQLPKRTSDGVWLCYHDDTFSISDTFLRNPDGSKIIDTTYDGMAFSQIPSSYLRQFDWGISAGDMYAGTGPCLIEDFFRLCAKTGMHPMLSFHPVAQSTIENFREIRALALKYGVLDRLGIKVPEISSHTNPALTRAFSVFGYDIESYTYNLAAGTEVSTAIAAFDAAEIDKTKVACVIEQFAGSVTADSIAAILEAGYQAGVAWASHTRPDGTSGSDLTQADLEYYLDLGVTVFTVQHFASFGLAW